MPRTAIFAALRWECAPVLRHMRNVQKKQVGEATVWCGRAAGHETWLVKTGMGLTRAAAAAAAVSNMEHFDLFLSTGCAGALASELGPGDLAVATLVVGTSAGERFETDRACRERVCAAAERAAVRATLGPMLSSPTVLASSSEKQAVAAKTGAVAVEMESAAIALCASQAGVPFAAVRAILDTVSTELDSSGGFVDPHTGVLRPLRLLRYVAQQPGRLRYLVSLQRMKGAAQRSLDRFFESFLSQL